MIEHCEAADAADTVTLSEQHVMCVENKKKRNVYFKVPPCLLVGSEACRAARCVSGQADVDVRQQLPVAAGGVGGLTAGALQEALVQQAACLGGRVADGQSLQLQAAVGGRLGETAAWLFLQDRGHGWMDIHVHF